MYELNVKSFIKCLFISDKVINDYSTICRFYEKKLWVISEISPFSDDSLRAAAAPMIRERDREANTT